MVHTRKNNNNNKTPLPLPLSMVETVRYLTASPLCFLAGRVHLMEVKILGTYFPSLPCHWGTGRWYGAGQWGRKALYCRLPGKIYFSLNRVCLWKRNQCPLIPTLECGPLKMLLFCWCHLWPWAQGRGNDMESWWPILLSHFTNSDLHICKLLIINMWKINPHCLYAYFFPILPLGRRIS